MSFYPPPLFRARVESKQCNAIVNLSLSEYKAPIAAAKQKLVWSIKTKIVDKPILLYCEHLVLKKIFFPLLKYPNQYFWYTYLEEFSPHGNVESPRF